jgi:transcriptional regulator with XRE-family HTH domain
LGTIIGMPDNVVRKVGRRIRELRQKKGWSHEKLAEIADLDRTYVGRIERGEKSIGVNHLRRVAVALGVHSSEILGVEPITDEGHTAETLADLTGLIGEYRALLGGFRRRRRESVEAVLIKEVDWTSGAAQHLVQLAHDYGSFMLRNAAAISIALDIEDGELGF